MKTAQIRIILEIGDNDHTWISVTPITGLGSQSVFDALNRAARAAERCWQHDSEQIAVELDRLFWDRSQ